jgi:hypothetical protein
MEDRRSCRSSHAGARRLDSAEDGSGRSTRRWRCWSKCGSGSRRGRSSCADMQDDGVQGDHARCRRSCSAAAAGGSAREQRAARRDGLARTAAEVAVPMQADHSPPGGRRDGYSAASSEGEAAQRDEAVRAEAVRRGSDARRRTDGWPGSIAQTRARARQQATREQVEGQGCGGKAGAVALRVDAQACRQCTHSSSQVEEGFFLCSVSSCASRNVLSAMR